MPSFRTETARDTVALGSQLGDLLQPGDVVLLTGDLGAGKTHFAQGVGRALGVGSPLTSPTFNILLVYEGDEVTLNHWDLYRLERADELIDVDYYAQVASGAVSLVEWGDKFAETSLDADLTLRITRTGEHERLIEVTAHSARGEGLADELTSAWAGRTLDDE